MSGLLDLTDIVADPIADVVLPFGEWLPDQMTVNNPGVLEALNVIPLEDGSYGPYPTFEPSLNGAAPEAIHGGLAALLPGNIVQLYLGGASGLYTRLGGAALSHILTTSVNQDYAWQFIRFKTLVVALHQDIFPVKMVVGATVAPVAVGGSPPRAACGAMVGDFLVLGNLFDDPDDAHNAAHNRIRWSGIKNIDANWVTNAGTESDYNDMPPEGGDVVAITGRTNMTIFQERAISIGRYVNLPSVWDIETIEDDVGCIARDSVVNVGSFKFFIAEDGFRVWNGTNSERIGSAKVDKYFFSRLQYGRRGRINGVYDRLNNCVIWGFPTGVDGSISELIIYSLKANRFTHTIQSMEYLMSSYVSSLTTDDLTGATDSDPRFVDDPSFNIGGRPITAMVSQGHLYGTFIGEPMAATLDTGEFSGGDGRRVFANSARPIVDLQTPIATIQPFGRDEMEGGTLLAGTAVAQEADGNCPILAEARFLRFRTNIPAGASWKHAVGVSVARKAGGKF